MSFKDEVRKSIIAITALAVATSFFTGCNSAQDIEDKDVYGPDLSTPVDDSNSNTDIVIDDKTPGGAPTEENSNTSTGDIVGPAASGDNTLTSEDNNSEPSNTSTGDVADTGDPSEDPSMSGDTSEPSGGDNNNSAPSSSDNSGNNSSPSSSGNSSSNNSSTPSTPSHPAGDVYEPQRDANGNLIVTGLTPSDTTGWELDAEGLPADGLAWKQVRGEYFVHASGQLYKTNSMGVWMLKGNGGGGAGQTIGGPSGIPVGGYVSPKDGYI